MYCPCVFFLLLGCGTGNYTVALSGYVGKVTGLEVNEGMLGRAMEKTAALKNVSLTQGDITKMPFQDNQFDGICCNQVNHSYAIVLCSLIYMPNLPAFQLLLPRPQAHSRFSMLHTSCTALKSCEEGLRMRLMKC